MTTTVDHVMVPKMNEDAVYYGKMNIVDLMIGRFANFFN